MTYVARMIRKNKPFLEEAWPAAAQSVSYVAGAWVVQAGVDFDGSDLDVVRGHFPDRRVTLDGDVITVWPRLREHP
ncbi:hypothetical protein [Streptomyces fulvoviolaceus]|uniref:hypothetical protein n=1 Tax=Streptomyces fulvoviolaceus TaxID=285535 RepID=UPI00131BE698|nr:hypothetical protein [Streptomyces fulvoviolaceus]